MKQELGVCLWNSPAINFQKVQFLYGPCVLKVIFRNIVFLFIQVRHLLKIDSLCPNPFIRSKIRGFSPKLNPDFVHKRISFIKGISSVSLQQTVFALWDVYSSSHRRFIDDYYFIFVYSWHHENCWQCTKFMSLRLDVLFNLNYGISSSVLIGHKLKNFDNSRKVIIFY